MQVRLIKKIRDITGLTNYGIQKALRAIGVDITVQGIDAYEKHTVRSMRLDVVIGLKELSKLDWIEFGKLLEKEFK